jgi:hypothetical protein
MKLTKTPTGQYSTTLPSGKTVELSKEKVESLKSKGYVDSKGELKVNLLTKAVRTHQKTKTFVPLETKASIETRLPNDIKVYDVQGLKKDRLLHSINYRQRFREAFYDRDILIAPCDIENLLYQAKFIKMNSSEAGASNFLLAFGRLKFAEAWREKLKDQPKDVLEEFEQW